MARDAALRAPHALRLQAQTGLISLRSTQDAHRRLTPRATGGFVRWPSGRRGWMLVAALVVADILAVLGNQFLLMAVVLTILTLRVAGRFGWYLGFAIVCLVGLACRDLASESHPAHRGLDLDRRPRRLERGRGSGARRSGRVSEFRRVGPGTAACPFRRGGAPGAPAPRLRRLLCRPRPEQSRLGDGERFRRQDHRRVDDPQNQRDHHRLLVCGFPPRTRSSPSSRPVPSRRTRWARVCSTWCASPAT